MQLTKLRRSARGWKGRKWLDWLQFVGYDSSMNAHASQILQVALKLQEKERAEIAAILMQSLEDADPAAEDEWDTEIQKRLHEMDSGKAKFLSRQEIEEVLKE